MKSLARTLWSAAFRAIDRLSIVGFWSRVFELLSKLVLLNVLGRVSKNITESYGFVELWVAARLVLSIILLAWSSAPGASSLECFFILIGAYSVFEALVVEVNVVFGDTCLLRKPHVYTSSLRAACCQQVKN